MEAGGVVARLGSDLLSGAEPGRMQGFDPVDSQGA